MTKKLSRYLVFVSALLVVGLSLHGATSRAQQVNSSFNAAAPGPIGGTTPSTGTFTALTAGNALTADPGLAIAASSAGQSCISLRGAGLTDYICDLSASTGMNFSLGGATRFQLQNSGQGLSAVGGTTIQSTGGAAPTLTAGCNGAGSSVAAGSTNNRGQVTTQTAASTTCTISWSAAGVWGQAPFCVFMGTPGLVPGACGTSTCVFSYSSISAATPINYVCM